MAIPGENLNPSHSSPSWWPLLTRSCFCLVLLVYLLGFFNYGLRNVLSGDVYGFRGTRKNGIPASLRTHIFTTALWGNFVLTSFGLSNWYPTWLLTSIFVCLIAAGMISARYDESEYDSSHIEGWKTPD